MKKTLAKVDEQVSAQEKKVKSSEKLVKTLSKELSQLEDDKDERKEAREDLDSKQKIEKAEQKVKDQEAKIEKLIEGSGVKVNRPQSQKTYNDNDIDFSSVLEKAKVSSKDADSKLSKLQEERREKYWELENAVSIVNNHKSSVSTIKGLQKTVLGLDKRFHTPSVPVGGTISDKAPPKNNGSEKHITKLKDSEKQIEIKYNKALVTKEKIKKELAKLNEQISSQKKKVKSSKELVTALDNELGVLKDSKGDREISRNSKASKQNIQKAEQKVKDQEKKIEKLIKDSGSDLGILKKPTKFLKLNFKPPVGESSSISKPSQSGLSAGNAPTGIKTWAQLMGATTDQKERNGAPGAESDMFGLVVGSDFSQIFEDVTVGAAFSFAENDSKSEGVNAATTNVNSFQLSVYSQFKLSKKLSLTTTAAYGLNKIESARSNVGNVASQTSEADYDATQISASATLSRLFQLWEFTIVPNLSVNWSQYRPDEYTETGSAGGLNLNVATEDSDSLSMGVGTSINWAKKNQNGSSLNYSFNIGYSYDLVIDNVITVSGFSAGGPTFVTESSDPLRGHFTTGLGVDYIGAGNWDFSLGYNLGIREKFQSHAGHAKVVYKF